jgi:alpha-N-acetylglucosamine transferase
MHLIQFAFTGVCLGYGAIGNSKYFNQVTGLVVASLKNFSQDKAKNLSRIYLQSIQPAQSSSLPQLGEMVFEF